MVPGLTISRTKPGTSTIRYRLCQLRYPPRARTSPLAALTLCFSFPCYRFRPGSVLIPLAAPLPVVLARREAQGDEGGMMTLHKSVSATS